MGEIPREGCPAVTTEKLMMGNAGKWLPRLPPARTAAGLNDALGNAPPEANKALAPAPTVDIRFVITLGAKRFYHAIHAGRTGPCIR